MSLRPNKLRLLVGGQVDPDEAEALIGYAADDLANRGIAPDVPRRDLLKTLAEIQLEALSRFEERDAGRVTITAPINAHLTAPDPMPATTTPANASGATLQDVLTAFHKERGDTLAPDTIDAHKLVVTCFQQIVGKIAARSITKRHVLDFKQALLDAPAGFSNKPELRGLTMPQAIKANAKLKKPYRPLSANSINSTYLAHLRTILQWATSNDYIDANPATGIRVDGGQKSHQEPTRLPFDQADLTAIFGHEMFADPAKYETRQWAILLAIYTGARSSSELAKLTTANVYVDQGVNLIHLQDASKNARSKRVVPVHTDLIALGFLDHVEALRNADRTFLFPEWATNTRTINEWFLRTFLPSVGIADSKKVLHSFRHTFKTAMSRHGIPRDVQDAMTGHADMSAAAGYIHAEPIKAMQEGLNRVTFELPIPALTPQISQ